MKLVINKNASEWKSAPILVRVGMLGIKSKVAAKRLEILSAILGIHGLLFFFFTTQLAHLSTVLFFFGAYWLSAACRYIDNHQLWTEHPTKMD
tara:strand:+ start:625 stop:903 length:279 start_codon:yes stop_codon:yes gene_type:complete